MSDLILELYIEEIPAFMQSPARQSYQDIFTEIFAKNDIKYKALDVYVSSRRITLHISNISSTISAKAIELRGPKVEAPENAINGFCYANNITKDVLVKQLVKDQEYYFYKSQIPEQKVSDLLPLILPEAINTHKWPKSMYWGDYDLKWVRPLKNIMCILNGKVLDFSFYHLKSNDITFGHHFMAYNEIRVSSFEDYEKNLRENFVILSREERKHVIETSISKITMEKSLVIKDDPKLIEEVVGIVEYPNVLLGKINDKFMHIPSEILVTAMRNHQRYFALYNKDGSFAPYFLFVSNIVTNNPENIISGNEKVLSARLSDSAFFYKQDQLLSLKTRVESLANVIFHAKLGSMKNKVDRITALAKFIDKENTDLHLAALLCKGDLATEIVSEFPELQGIIGGYYARIEGHNEKVVYAISNHYKPEGLEDKPPEGIGAMLALIDKIDSLVSLYHAGERSTGSKDPYALRRYALGIIRIIIDNKISLNMGDIVSYILSMFNASDNIKIEVLEFLEGRLNSYLKGFVSLDVINATINLSKNSNILVSYNKALTLDRFIKTESGKNLVHAYKRANNIIGENVSSNLSVDENILKEESEKNLFYAVNEVGKKLENLINLQDFNASLELLASLLLPVNSFFDNVTVNDSDTQLANNRIAILKKAVSNFNKFANFSEIK